MSRLPGFALCVFTITLLPLINGRLRPALPRPKSLKFVEECSKELTVNLVDFTDEDFDKLPCMGKCVAVKEGYMSEDGELLFEQVNKKFNSAGEKEAEEILKKCVAVTEEDPCKKIMAMHTCIFKYTDLDKTMEYIYLVAVRNCMKEKNITEMPHSDEVKEEKYRCFSSCIYHKLGWMNEQGVVNKERVFATLPEDGKTPDVRQCFDQTETEHCALAAKIDECIYTISNLPEEETTT